METRNRFGAHPVRQRFNVFGQFRGIHDWKT